MFLERRWLVDGAILAFWSTVLQSVKVFSTDYEQLFFTRDVRHLQSPNQPTNITFPKLSGKKETFGRSFQSRWFNDFSWLHYHEKEDAVYCFTCLKAIENNALSELAQIQSDAFTKSGYKNWKKALEKNKGFNAHQNSSAHKEATARYITQKPSDTTSVDHLINSATKVQMAENRRMFLKILSNIRFLGKISVIQQLIFLSTDSLRIKLSGI